MLPPTPSTGTSLQQHGCECGEGRARGDLGGEEDSDLRWEAGRLQYLPQAPSPLVLSHVAAVLGNSEGSCSGIFANRGEAV